jgi:hypothetical protein
VKTHYRQSRHKEYVGDKHGNLYFNKLKYFEFHSYPGHNLHKWWCVILIVLMLFKLGSLFELSVFSGMGGVYVLYLAAMTLYLLTKQICRQNGYFLYPSAVIKFLKKRRKSVESSEKVA